jgi:hypothetical protein
MPVHNGPDSDRERLKIKLTHAQGKQRFIMPISEV